MKRTVVNRLIRIAMSKRSRLIREARQRRLAATETRSHAVAPYVREGLGSLF
jgi:hypothetical protein